MTSGTVLPRYGRGERRATPAGERGAPGLAAATIPAAVSPARGAGAVPARATPPRGAHVPGSTAPVSREEERRLFRAWRAGDLAARERLVAANLRFVAQIARRMRAGDLTYDQRFSAGCDGLLEALERYEVDRGHRFITYAVWWIRQRIDTACREGSLVGGIGMRHRLAELDAAAAQLEQRAGRRLSDAELQTAMGWTDDRCRLAAQARAAMDPAWLDDPIDPQSPATGAWREVRDPLPDPEEQAMIEQAAERLQVMVDTLPCRERLVVRLYFGLDGCGDDRTLMDVGRELGVGTERARQLLERGLTLLREQMTGAFTTAEFGI